MRNFIAAIVQIGYSFVAAVQLLSRFPLPVQVPYEERVLRRSVVFYPVVGLFIGLVLAIAGWGTVLVLPAGTAAAFLTGLWVALTGGLHLDGLMDTADGVLSHRSRERMLEIMKDSRVGAMGVIVCVLQLLMKYALLSALLANDGKLQWSLLLLVPVWSRWYMTAAIAIWPYARKGEGMGALFREVGTRELALSSLAAAVISLAVLAGALGGTGWSTAALLSACGAAISGGAGTLAAARLARKLGGLTGDTYGAVNELAETALLLGVVLYLGGIG
ncbi:MAG: cobalamin 5-phosphate synthase [Paenibacillaceae bacterium]|nr:cobalamin 5-phosphate synthase [Paenibacillaceae bacterium]